MNAARPPNRPMTMSAPQTSSIHPATTAMVGSWLRFIPSIGGAPRIFCVPWSMNMSPTMIRMIANAGPVKRPTTCGIQHLACGRLSRSKPGSCARIPDCHLLMRKALLVALLVAAAACHRRPTDTSVGSTDTLQPSSTGTTATETGGGTPVTDSTPATTNTTTASTATTARGNASGSGGTGTSGTSTY